MSETFFPVNDLLRRKFHTGLVVISLTLCVASTTFLLLFGGRMGVEISSAFESKLTTGFSLVFSRFLLFAEILAFAVGMTTIAFMVFAMMSERVRDIGLMKATGCPNDLVFGYFVTELLILTFLGCFLGVIFGIMADFAFSSLLNSFGFYISQKPVNLWIVTIVFALFFALSVVSGVKPILDTTRIQPAKAILPRYYIEPSERHDFRVVSKSGLTIKVAIRSLFRRKSATIQIVLCLTVVFILVTVAIAGGLIASRTTKSWVEKAVGRNVVLVAHQDMGSRYRLLLARFYKAEEGSQFNYTGRKYLVPEDIINNLISISDITHIDSRLVLETHVKEVPGYLYDEETASILSIGDAREGESLIIGIEPERVVTEWFSWGKFLKRSDNSEAVIGDSLAQKLFSMPLNQSVRFLDSSFDIVGVCLDPIQNGNVTYVPLKTLQNITGISGSNIVMVRIDVSANYTDTLEKIHVQVGSVSPEFQAFSLDELLEENLGFLSHIWTTIMILPVCSLAAAFSCLGGYMMLTIAEQRQEFGVLRAVGVKPGAIVKIISLQSLVVLSSSYVAGTAIGIILTLLLLVPEPLVTYYTIIEITVWLLIALATTAAFSLVLAIKFGKKPITEIMV